VSCLLLVITSDPTRLLDLQTLVLLDFGMVGERYLVQQCKSSLDLFCCDRVQQCNKLAPFVFFLGGNNLFQVLLGRVVVVGGTRTNGRAKNWHVKRIDKAARTRAGG
jgi:hypothetical protein